jgi:hypothetical protein
MATVVPAANTATDPWTSSFGERITATEEDDLTDEDDLTFDDVTISEPSIPSEEIVAAIPERVPRVKLPLAYRSAALLAPR